MVKDLVRAHIHTKKKEKKDAVISKIDYFCDVQYFKIIAGVITGYTNTY